MILNKQSYVFVYLIIYHFIIIKCNSYKSIDFDYGSDEDINAPRNLIMMIPDGTSPGVMALARSVNDPTMYQRLYLDDYLMGSVRTYSNSSMVTDSAASATAYSTGEKTFDGAIGVDINGKPLGTILEAAKNRNMIVGMIVTSRVTDATPASFASHVLSRHYEKEIAYEYVHSKKLDFLLGGGKRFFNQSLLHDLKKYKYDILENINHLNEYVENNEKSGKLKFFGLFADDYLDYEIDRLHDVSLQNDNMVQPSLSYMVEKVFQILKNNEKAKKNGFFIMIEGSRVDHAAHENDVSTIAKEFIEFDKTFKKVIDMVDHLKNTAVIAVSDHGTGGLSLGRDGIYKWVPKIVKNVNISAERIKKMVEEKYYNLCLPEFVKNHYKYPIDPKILQRHVRNHTECHNYLTHSIKNILISYANITNLRDDYNKIIKSEIDCILRDGPSIDDENIIPEEKLCGFDRLLQVIALGISEKAGVAFSSSGHVGEDVNLYCKGPFQFERMCKGVHDNTYINHIMTNFLKLNVQRQTLSLRGM